MGEDAIWLGNEDVEDAGIRGLSLSHFLIGLQVVCGISSISTLLLEMGVFGDAPIVWYPDAGYPAGWKP